MATTGYIDLPVASGGGGGSGTVTSVGLTAPASLLSVSGSPVTTAGTLTLALVTQSANTILAGPTTGADADPTFRTLVAADIPSLSSLYYPVEAGIEIGSTVDDYGRPQIWDHQVNSVLRMGAAVADGDPFNEPSNGVLVYGKNSNGDPMDGTNFSFTFIEPLSVSLYNAINASAGFDVVLNNTHLLLTDDAFAPTFEVTRATGTTMVGSLTANRAVVSDASKILTSSATTDTEIGYVNGVTSSIQTQLDSKLSGLIVANRQTASYTLVLTDASKIVEMNVASANNLTVPLNASVAFPIGTQIILSQYGSGQTTVVATGGVTIRSALGALNLATQYSGATLVKIDTDEWYLFGDIAV